MIRKVAMCVLLVGLVGCDEGNSNGGSASQPSSETSAIDPEDRLGTELCTSEKALERCEACIKDRRERIPQLAKILSVLHQPGSNTWYSIWFELKAVNRRYQFTETEKACLKREFCQPKQ